MAKEFARNADEAACNLRVISQTKIAKLGVSLMSQNIPYYPADDVLLIEPQLPCGIQPSVIW